MRTPMGPWRYVLVSLISLVLFVAGAQAQKAGGPRVSDPAAVLDATAAAAEAALRDGELEIADSRYRALLLDAWMLVGELHVAAGRLEKARAAFHLATASAVDATPAFHALAVVQLQMGDAADAVALLTKLAGRNPRDHRTRRLLAQALIANGEPEEAVQSLEEAHGGSPNDPEITFLLASGYLRLKKIPAAERLFARVLAARPLPETYVLVGRTYRDAGLFDRARGALLNALEMNPRTRRAHYYLGTLAAMAEGAVRLEDAAAEFRAELKLAPDDPLANLRLGMVLVGLRRYAEALPALEIASRSPSAGSDTFHYLGRCQLALDRPADAVRSFQRALDLGRSTGIDDPRLRHIHYQLGVALRAAGAAEEAALQFAEAERVAAKRADSDREKLEQFLSDAPTASREETSTVLPVQSSFSGLPPVERERLERRVATVLARAYMNLGVMQAQARRFARASEFFAQAAEAEPEFPEVQYSLGVAHFNAQQYENAIAPLGRALASDPSNGDVRRMLALASLHAGAYEKAAELLASDPHRDADASLQYAYALALVRSGRAAEAEAVFTQLLAAHGTTPELQVLVGQAYAQQGDFESAIAALQRALQLKPDVADANATLGQIYLKQGRLAEAQAALRLELRARPEDPNAGNTLATILDLEGEQEEAVRILRLILRSRPGSANARYLLGKILLARGAADEAVEHLEAGARLAPEDANIHYQLAQAYRKQGRGGLADERFAIYQQLKDKQRTR
jgi:tetratricopeptide (TPR) repeat protein